MGLQIDPQRTRYAVFVVALIAFVVVLFRTAPLVWSVLQIFIIATLVTLALDGPVRWLMARGAPRWAAVLNVLFLLLVLVIALISFLIPPLVEQARQFSAFVPVFWAQFTGQLNALTQRFPQVAQALDLNKFVSNLFSGAGSLAMAARSVFTSTVGAVTATILIFVTVLYTLLNPWPLLYGIRGLFPTDWWGEVDRLAGLIAGRIRAWVVGTLVLSLIIGILDYSALLITNLVSEHKVPFILLFAIIGGLLEVIPVVGPIIATVLPSLVAFAIDPALGLIVLSEFFLIQQLEGTVLSPIVMNRAVQLHPVTLVFTLVLLSGLFGLFGALIAVPVASTLKVFYDEWYYPLIHQGKHPQHPPKESPRLKPVPEKKAA